MKGKAYATTLRHSESSNSDLEDSYDEEGNFLAFMTITHVESSEDLNLLVQELGEHNEVDKDIAGFQENYNSLLEKSGEYARVAKAAVKKMKKAEEDYRSLLVRYKKAKCKIETLTGELIEAYIKVKFLKREVAQANAKVDRVSTKKLDDVISSQKTFSEKTGLGYTRESSLDVKVTKEVKFVKAKDPKGVIPTVEKANVEKKKNMADQRVLNKPCNQSTVRLEAKGRSPPNSQRGPRTNHVAIIMDFKDTPNLIVISREH